MQYLARFIKCTQTTLLTICVIALHCTLLPGGQPSGNNAPLISPDEFNALVNELSQYSPEELEQMEREIWASMSAEEQEQVRKYQRQILADMGYDPNVVLGPEQSVVPPPQPTPQQVPPQPTQKAEPKKEKKGEQVIEQSSIHTLITDLIHTINTLKKIVGTSSIATQHDLMPDLNVLSQLVWYLYTLDKKQYHEIMASRSHEPLIRQLTTLYDELHDAEIQLKNHAKKITEESTLPEPYQTLGVTMSATPEEVTEAYNQLIDKYDPRAIKEDEGNPADMQRRLRRAKQMRNVIEDAYQQLSDETLRAELDAQALAQSEAYKDQVAEIRNASQTITDALNDALDQDIISKIEQVFKTYEPESAARRAELEKAIKARRAEQEAAHKITASRTPGSFEPLYAPASSYYSGHESSRGYTGYPSSRYGDYGAGASPSRSPFSSSSEAQKKQGFDKKGGDKKAADDKMPSDKKKQEQADQKAASSPAKKDQKPKDDPSARIVKNIQAHLNVLLEAVDQLTVLLSDEHLRPENITLASDPDNGNPDLAKKILALSQKITEKWGIVHDKSGEIKKSFASLPRDKKKIIQKQIADAWDTTKENRRFIEHAKETLNQITLVAGPVRSEPLSSKAASITRSVLPSLKDTLAQAQKALNNFSKDFPKKFEVVLGEPERPKAEESKTAATTAVPVAS